ncbi:hypothetical protein YC2023_108519 [Brassica napus]
MSWLFDARGKIPKEPFPVRPPADTRRSALATLAAQAARQQSTAYIVPSTRGCSPWRPDAVMSTTRRERHSVLRIFKGRRECTGHHATCGALPAVGPYLRLSHFQGMLTLKPFSEDQGRSVGCAPVRDPANQHPCALRVYSPVDSHTCQTPLSVFQDGSNGEPTGRCPEHADAKARREARAADHD